MVQQLLSVFLPILDALPENVRSSKSRVGGFPGQTYIGNHIYDRRPFNRLTREVGEDAVVPKPHVTLHEHQRRALSEPGHLGEAWVQEDEYLSKLLLNTSAAKGLYSHYYEGADGPVPDLQEARAVVRAGSFAARLLPEIRQKVYLQLALTDLDCTGGLLPLGSTCRLLRAEVLAFQRAHFAFAFAFNEPIMLKRFLQYNEPGKVLLRHKENILTLGCVLIDIRVQRNKYPSPEKTVRVDLSSKEQTDIGRRGERVLDKLEAKIHKSPETEATEVMDWVEPMMKLLKGWKIQTLVIRREFGTAYLLSKVELVECLIGCKNWDNRTVAFKHIGGWDWNALQYTIMTVKNHWEEDDWLRAEDDIAKGLKDQKIEDADVSKGKTDAAPMDFEAIQRLIDMGYEESDLAPEDLKRLKFLRRPQHGFRRIWTDSDGTVPK